MTNGILIVNKDSDWTSHDVVAKIRNIFGTKKVGHTGTLDPMARGVLPICIGKATKLAQYVSNDKKSYIVEAKTGFSTNTYDITGQVVSKSDIEFSQTDLEKSIQQFTGNIKQKPPMYSAVKYKGKKLYEYARRGVEVERKSRDVTVYNIEILQSEIDSFKLRIECSSGTYIRSLIHDIGIDIGCLATMSSLIRDSVGSYTLNDSISINELINISPEDRIKFILPMDSAIKHLNVLDVDPSFVFSIKNGQKIYLDQTISENIYGIYSSNTFLGVGIVVLTDGKKVLKMKNVFI